jgi:ribulose 1,5-bisphosphate carboxylase large subunit-like protein
MAVLGILTLMVGIQAMFAHSNTSQFVALQRQLLDHLKDDTKQQAEYNRFAGRVDVTMEFFSRHFAELDKALNHRSDNVQQ